MDAEARQFLHMVHGMLTGLGEGSEGLFPIAPAPCRRGGFAVTTAAEQSARDDLRAALRAASLDASDARVETLLPSYEGMHASAARLRALDLNETEPVVIFRLPVR